MKMQVITTKATIKKEVRKAPLFVFILRILQLWFPG